MHSIDNHMISGSPKNGICCIVKKKISIVYCIFCTALPFNTKTWSHWCFFSKNWLHNCIILGRWKVFLHKLWFTSHGYYCHFLSYFLFRDWRTSHLIMYSSRSHCMIHALARWHFIDHSTSPTLFLLSHPRHTANVSDKTWQQRALSKIGKHLFKD